MARGDRLFFDIETVGHGKVKQWVPKEDPDLGSISAPSNYKDQAKIDAYIEKATERAKEKVEENYQQALDEAPLDMDLCRVDSIATRINAGGTTIVSMVCTKPPKLDGEWSFAAQWFKRENQLIEWFWEQLLLTDGCSVGFNIIGFDFPVLLRRSMDLGIEPTLLPDLRSYEFDPTCDLMRVPQGGKRVVSKDFKWLGKRYGYDDPLPDVTGDQYANMDILERLAYVANDIDRLVFLWRKMNGVYWWPIAEKE